MESPSCSTQRAFNERRPFHRLRQWPGRRLVHDRDPNKPAESNSDLFGDGLKALINRGLPFELVDVLVTGRRARHREDRQGFTTPRRGGHDYLLSLDRNTTILFHCHHGIRSQSHAEYFLREKGFLNLYNLRGGIDAWSQLVDPSVPATEIRPTWSVGIDISSPAHRVRSRDPRGSRTGDHFEATHRSERAARDVRVFAEAPECLCATDQITSPWRDSGGGARVGFGGMSFEWDGRRAE